MVLMYPRTVKVRSKSGTVNEYVRVVEAYREGSKVKQRVVADLGRKDLLLEVLPKLRRLLTGEDRDPADPQFGEAPDWGPVLVVRALFDQLGLWGILDRYLGQAKGVPFADRAFVLVANRLIAPASEHGLAGWLEPTSSATARADASSPTGTGAAGPHPSPPARRLVPHLDQLHAAKDQIEVALYHRLRDLFSLKPDLVLYDITRTYFEGAGPQDFAKHGYSGDGKSQNVQVIIGMVMVAGWPIADHVWAGNRIDHSTVQEVISDLCNRFEFGRLIFVGDRGMVTDKNIDSITKDNMDSSSGSSGGATPSSTPGSMPSTTRSGSTVPAASIPGNGRPTRRAPRRGSPSGDPDLRVIVIDSDEHRGYEQAKREQAMERARQRLEKLKERIAAGDLKRPEKIGAAVERIMQKYHGHRYFDWKLNGGALGLSESETHLGRKRRSRKDCDHDQ